MEDFSKESSEAESPGQQRVGRVQSLRDHNVNFLEADTSDYVRRIHTAEYTEYTEGELLVQSKLQRFLKIMYKVNYLKH